MQNKKTVLFAELDPCDIFYKRGATEESILNALGYVPGWVVDEWYLDVPLRKALEEQYKFPMPPIEDFIVNDDASLQYPGDPALYPLVKIKRGEETFYQYEHSWVCIKQKDGSTFITRMD